MTRKYNMLAVLLASTFLSSPAMAVEPTLDRLDDDFHSSYSLAEISDKASAGANALTFTESTINADGSVTNQDYQVSVKTDTLDNLSMDFIKWQSVSSLGSNTISVNIPGEGVKYYQYSYNANDYVDSGRTFYTNGWGLSPSAGADVNADFIKIKLDAALNVKGQTIGNITGDFIENNNRAISITEQQNAPYTKGVVGSITGNFIGNYFENNAYTYGGAIYNKGTVTGNIKGHFINNHVTLNLGGYVLGGAIANYGGTMKDITGDFINNYAEFSNIASGTIQGGAIYNHGSIGNIVGNFIGNFLSKDYIDRPSATSWANGGAIYNANYYGSSEGSGSKQGSPAITSITGDFIGNHISGMNYTSGSVGHYAEGGAIYNGGYIGAISGDFIGNYAESQYLYAYGGAINNYQGSINKITGNFIGNYVTSTNSDAEGGAINNRQGYITGDITGDFIGNYAKTTYGPYAQGGAIYNKAYSNGTSGYANLGNIFGNFTDNYALSEKTYAQGGAIYNDAFGTGTYSMSAIIQGKIVGDFINNSAQAPASYAQGGAIYNRAFNNASSSASAVISGGITGHFNGNFVISETNYVQGGAIYNEAFGTASTNSLNAIIQNVSLGNFIGNYAKTTNGSYAQGGAIYNNAFNNNPNSSTQAIISGNISGNFIDNFAVANGYAQGGAIYNNAYGRLSTAVLSGGSNIVGDFINNYAESTSSYAQGGAIYNYRDMWNGGSVYMGDISGSFIGNHVSTASANPDLYAFGGAIYTNGDMNFTNTGTTYFFQDNYAEDAYYGKRYNSIFVNSSGEASFIPSLIFTMSEKGVYVINDSISGGNVINGRIWDYNVPYNLIFTSDNTGTVYLADDIINANISVNNSTVNVLKYTHSDGVETTGGFGRDEISIYDNDPSPRSSLTLNGSTLGLHNNYYDKLYLKHYEGNGALLHLNVGYVDGKWVADFMDMVGDIKGRTGLIVYDLVKADNSNAYVPFAQALYDTVNKEDAFYVSRVFGSPYMWEAVRNYLEEDTEGSTWYLVANTEENPDYEVPDAPEAPEYTPPKEEPNREVAPEVITGEGLHEAAIEQTRSVVRNVGKKVALGKEYCNGCGVMDADWDGKQLRNIWVTAQGETAEIDKPVDMDADIWGVEAGFDIQNDRYNTLGVFASYRKGEYDLSGKGHKYYSTIGSEIDIDSWLGGLYYRYDKNMNWVFATLYGGISKADMKTDDNVTKYDTDGIEFGGSIEGGHTFALSDSITLDPSVGLYYTQIKFDKARDTVGKTYRWSEIKHLEGEAGISLNKQFENAKVYVKPSVIRTLTTSDKVKISGLGEVDTYKDGTLGRVEIGGRYGFTDSLSGYGWANYTFGSGYSATAAGLGISYSW